MPPKGRKATTAATRRARSPSFDEQPESPAPDSTAEEAEAPAADPDIELSADEMEVDTETVEMKTHTARSSKRKTSDATKLTMSPFKKPTTSSKRAPASQEMDESATETATETEEEAKAVEEAFLSNKKKNRLARTISSSSSSAVDDPADTDYVADSDKGKELAAVVAAAAANGVAVVILSAEEQKQAEVAAASAAFAADVGGDDSNALVLHQEGKLAAMENGHSPMDPNTALKECSNYFEKVDPELFEIDVREKPDGAGTYIAVSHPQLGRAGEILLPFCKVAWDGMFPYGNLTLFAKFPKNKHNTDDPPMAKFSLGLSTEPWFEAHEKLGYSPHNQALIAWCEAANQAMIRKVVALPVAAFNPEWRETADREVASKFKAYWDMMLKTAKNHMKKGQFEDLEEDQKIAWTNDEQKIIMKPTVEDYAAQYAKSYTSFCKAKTDRDAPVITMERYVFTKLTGAALERKLQHKYEYTPQDDLCRYLFETHNLVLSDVPMITSMGRLIAANKKNCPGGSVVAVRVKPRLMMDSPQKTFGLRLNIQCIIFHRNAQNADNAEEHYARQVETLGITGGEEYDEASASAARDMLYTKGLRQYLANPNLVKVKSKEERRAGAIAER